MAQYNVGFVSNPNSITNYDNDITQNMLPNSPFLFFQDDNTTSPTDESSSPYRLSSIDFSNTSQSVDDVFGIHSSSDDNPYMLNNNMPITEQNLFTTQDNDSALNPTFFHSLNDINPDPSKPAFQPMQGAEQRLSNNPRMLELNIYHKPRGCKGIWQPVEKGSALRVTKGKGKWLKLEIKSPVPITAKETQLTLIEDNAKDAKTMLDAHRAVSDSLTIETISEYQKAGFWYIDTELKLDTVSKRLQFYAVATTPSGNVTGYSVAFSGHNNGKANLSKTKDSTPEMASPSSEDIPTAVSRQNSITDTFHPAVIQDTSFDYRHKRNPNPPLKLSPLSDEADVMQGSGKRAKVENYSTTTTAPFEHPHDAFSHPMYPVPSPPESPLLKEYSVPETFPIRNPSNQNFVIDTSLKSSQQIPFPTDPIPRVNMAFGQGPTTVLSGPLEVHGSVRATSFIQFSDMRLKADIQDLLGAVDIISKLEGKSYTWKPEETDELTGGRRVIGLIAQQVQKVLPEVVMEDPVTGMLSVSYTEIIPVLIEAFKAQMKTYQSDKQEMMSLLNVLSSKMDELSAQKNKSIPTKFDFTIETGDVDSMYPNSFSARLSGNPILHQGIKFGSIFGFTMGIILIVLGAIALGILLARPLEKTTIFVDQATGLQPLGTNTSINPDPFCEVTAGTAFFRTKTLYDTRNPAWEQAFVATDDTDYISEIAFKIFDDSTNYSEMTPRPMGYASFNLGPDFPVGQYVTKTLPLLADSHGQIVRGQLTVAVIVKLRNKPDWEVALIVVGVVAAVVSAILGSFVWINRPFPFFKKLYQGYVVAEDVE